MNALGIWMNGELVGTWEVSRGRRHTLRYASSWLESRRSRSLSLSLPRTSSGEVHGDKVSDYFDNLLPDDPRLRERLRRRYGLRSTEPMDLLSAVGRDCVGAVQLLPVDVQPKAPRELLADPLDDAAVERHIDSMLAGRDDPTHEDDDFRISIAGAQEKTALLRIDGQWYQPRGSTPTTHILKLPLGLVGNMQADMRDSVENEWLCLKLLGHMGLPVAEAEIATFGERKALVVERFDRQWMDDGTWLARIPQEDFCQALGKPPGDKYEAHGGPGISDCLRLLAGSSDAADRPRFLVTQLAFWMLGATDGHAKNFSLFIEAGDRYQTTPLYDVLSAWPVVGPGANEVPRQKMKLAMAVRTLNTHYRVSEIEPRHWLELDEQHGMRSVGAMRMMAQTVPLAIDAAASELPPAFPEQVWDSITGAVRQQAAAFLRGT